MESTVAYHHFTSSSFKMCLIGQLLFLFISTETYFGSFETQVIYTDTLQFTFPWLLVFLFGKMELNLYSGQVRIRISRNLQK